MLTPKLLTTLKTYNFSQFMSDLAAGLTVAMVAIPLSLAIAIASGAAPAQGLVTAAVAGFLMSLLGGSRVQIGGPTGAFIVVVFGIIAEHGISGLIVATLMAGMILTIAGYFRLGGLIRMIPEAVIEGFTVGIAIVIATRQIKFIFGLDVASVPAGFLEKLPVLWEARASFSPVATGLAVATMVLIGVLRHFAPRFPGLIVAVGATSILALITGVSVESIHSNFGALPTSLPAPQLPDLSLSKLIALAPSAIVIAFLAGVETLLSAMVSDRMIGGSHRPNAELMATGIANIGSALFAGLPATGAIARTVTNVRAGGRTPVAGLVHAVVVVLAIYFLSDLAGYMIMPALGGLLLLVAWNMSEPHRWPDRLSMRRSDLALLILTAVLTVLVDLTVAIGTGTALGLALRLRRRDAPPSDWSAPDR